jgi:hypothetical protein
LITPKWVSDFDWRFDTCGDPELEAMLAACQQFLLEMVNFKRGARPRWLTLTGTSGTGKTHLMRRIFAVFHRHLYGYQYKIEDNHVHECDGQCWDYRRMVNQFRDQFYGTMERASDDWFFGLDDISADNDPNKFGVGKLLEILNLRERKWTVITSNLLPADIAAQMDVRIMSRLLRNDSVVVVCKAMDYNLRKK